MRHGACSAAKHAIMRHGFRLALQSAAPTLVVGNSSSRATSSSATSCAYRSLIIANATLPAITVEAGRQPRRRSSGVVPLHDSDAGVQELGRLTRRPHLAFSLL